jgi:serine/threonine protein kinase
MKAVVVAKLVGFVLRQVIPVPVAADVSARVVESVGAYVDRCSTDHSKKLLTAIDTAYTQAWQALELALAGDGFLRAAKRFVLGSNDAESIADAIREFLREEKIGVLQSLPDTFRRKCLDELKLMRLNGYPMKALRKEEVAAAAARFQRYSDQSGLVDGACLAACQIAEILEENYPNLASLLRQSEKRGGTDGKKGVALVVVAFTHFLRLQIEQDQELANGLIFDGLRQLSTAQAMGFAKLGAALKKMGGRFDQVFEKLDEIKDVAVETRGVVVETHSVVVETRSVVDETRGAVLGLSGLIRGHDEQIRELSQSVMKLLEQYQLEKRALQPGDSLSIRNDNERQLVKEVVARYRGLPEDQRQRTPALLNAIGKLQVVAGDFDAAQRDFQQVATMVSDATEKAEAHFNAYRAALERNDWDTALHELIEAVKLDGRRFALFPGNKYSPKCILGAGGFGVAFLCRHKFMNDHIVVKTITQEDLEQDADKVFSEANLLNEVKKNNSDADAIIGIHDCGFLEVKRKAKPYLVMEYFESVTLEDYVKKNGPLSIDEFFEFAEQVARGLGAAHGRDVLHRDVKPANLLVRKEGSGFRVKIIDFGLALKQKLIARGGSTDKRDKNLARSSQKSVIGNSIAGTLDYAAPEQMGRRNEHAGAYSDIYGFAKTCCYSLFQTPQPLPKHWKSVPPPLADLLGRCLEEDPKQRPESFAAVLEDLKRAKEPNGVGTATAPMVTRVLRAARDAIPMLKPASAPPPSAGNGKKASRTRNRLANTEERRESAITKKFDVVVAFFVGFLFGPIGAGIYFRSFKEFLIPLGVMVAAGVLVPGIGAIPGWFFSGFYSLFRAKHFNKLLEKQDRVQRDPD